MGDNYNRNHWWTGCRTDLYCNYLNKKIKKNRPMSTPLWLQDRIPIQVYFRFRKLPKLIWVILISLKGKQIYHLLRGCNYCSNQAAAWKQLRQHKHKALKLGLVAFLLSTTEATRQFDPMHMVIVQQPVKEIRVGRTEQRRTMFTALLFVCLGKSMLTSVHFQNTNNDLCISPSWTNAEMQHQIFRSHLRDFKERFLCRLLM